MSVRATVAAMGAAAVLGAAACGGAGATVGGEGGSGPRWVELDPSAISLDKLNLESDEAEEASDLALPESISRAEALAELPFELALPAWVPEGFSLQEQVEVVQAEAEGNYTSAIVTWQNAAEAAIYLQVTQGEAKTLGLGSAGQAEPATVNGSPATLVRSATLGSERLSLNWQRSGLDYSLSTDGSTVTAADLVQIAESIP